MNKQFKCNVRDIDDRINALVQKYFANGNEDLMREMFTAVAKLGLESTDRGDMRLLNTNIKELRYAFNLFSKYRDVHKVAIFGSARTPENSPQYKMAEEFARSIVQKGFMVITGAGGGIMEAGNKGAGSENSFGINIRLPFEQQANDYISGSRLINFNYFFTRKLIFQKESDATVLLPGGFGTIDEGMEVLTLVQTGKSKPRPVLLLQPEGDNYWSGFYEFIQNNMLRDGYISEKDLSLFKVVENTDRAVEEIFDFYRIYHSIRYIGAMSVLRFKKPVPEEVVHAVNEHFQDIMVKGAASICSPYEEEMKDNDFPDLYRMEIPFNRKDYGRLIELIRFVNKKMNGGQPVTRNS